MEIAKVDNSSMETVRSAKGVFAKCFDLVVGCQGIDNVLARRALA